VKEGTAGADEEDQDDVATDPTFESADRPAMRCSAPPKGETVLRAASRYVQVGLTLDALRQRCTVS